MLALNLSPILCPVSDNAIPYDGSTPGDAFPYRDSVDDEPSDDSIFSYCTFPDDDGDSNGVISEESMRPGSFLFLPFTSIGCIS